MKINILSPSTTSLNNKNDGNNVQGDEIVARLWIKNLISDERVTFVDLNGKRNNYDLSISFSPLLDITSGYKVLYMQNVFPKPYWPGTVEMFLQVKNNYNEYIFPSDGLRTDCKQENSLVLQFATDLDVYNKKQYNSKLDYNVCFVGNKIRNEQTNQKFLLCVDNKGLAIFGNQNGWNIDKCYGKISIEDEATLYSSSKICLNAHLDEHLKYGSFNFRIFNILACNGFLISDYSIHLEKEFKDCMVFTDGNEDLKNKVDYYLTNPEKTVKFRNNGLKLIQQKHTFKHRMNELLNWAEKRI